LLFFEMAPVTSTAQAQFRGCPKRSVVVGPGRDLAAVVRRREEGTTFCVRSGLYRLRSTIVPKRGDRLFFQQGAKLSGARRLTNWSKDDSHWIASGQTQSFPPYDVPCEINPAACEYEDLFMDGAPLVRVMSIAELVPGTFYFDEATDKIHLAQDPAGHEFEAPRVSTAIEGRGAFNVTIRGATIEMFGLNGIVTSSGWTLKNNKVRYVHSHGLRVFDGTSVIGNSISFAGNLGILGQGDHMIFRNNDVHHNNYLRFGKTSGYWHAGGAKIVKSEEVVVEGNHSHANVGDGWWFDTDNLDVLIRNNVFDHNRRFGLLYEKSQKARIVRNVFRRNGEDRKFWGAGAWIEASKNVELAANLFTHNRSSALAVSWGDRGSSSRFGEYQLTNLWVHDNRFRMTDGFIGVGYGDDRIYSSNNRFEGNRYWVDDRSAAWWSWDGLKTWRDWRSIGHDASGTLRRLK
jgi:Right handed beta helix region